MVEPLGKSHLAWFRSTLTGRHDWLLSSFGPQESRAALSASEFSFNMRLLLCLPLKTPVVPDQCPCGLAGKGGRLNESSGAYHFASCTHELGGWTIAKHNNVVCLLDEFIQSAPLSACVIHANNRKVFHVADAQKDVHADSICVIGETEYIIDVTARNPSAPSYYKKYVDKVLLGAEKVKRDHFDGYTGSSVFVPFAYDLNGNLSPSALEFLGRLFAYDKSKDRVVLKAFLRRFSLCIARDLNNLSSCFHANICGATFRQ